ncbi:hypothetical protein [Sphingobacterium sp. 1.A.4]|uniref:hypothetical protein n=1 Tax=Sphingobacterium sp. 1.A.4 TaxID=2044603 RepID=UPI0015D4F506|nr:hypothetical protein [Sphingobacterium sp. 1.A.4]
MKVKGRNPFQVGRSIQVCLHLYQLVSYPDPYAYHSSGPFGHSRVLMQNSPK